ncbi:MAG: hypothetical protein Kow0047_03210 [Anaerolineae bacterium]
MLAFAHRMLWIGGVIALLFASLVGTSVEAAQPQDDPPPPQRLPATGDCVVDNIYYGAVPPNPNGHVLVFVHGLSGLAEDWWTDNSSAGLNDMYLLAYAAGYRTAFVNLTVQDAEPPDCTAVRRPANDMMGSGKILSQQIAAITAYYGVDQVDIVAHSKGGVDAQAAAVWWGAASKIRRVFTLSTPHQGSLLADLLWSPEGFWVSLLLGQRDEATYSMQTSSMQIFRLMTDSMAVDDAIRYYTAAGTFWNRPGTIFELTGAYLQNHPDGGDNDGAVTVSHAWLAEGQTLFIQPWDHAQIYIGHNAFPYVHQVIQAAESPHRLYLPVIAASTGTMIGEPVARRASPPAMSAYASDRIVRGGHGSGSLVERIPVEPEARAVRWGLVTSGPAAAWAESPAGEEIPLAPVSEGELPYLPGAHWFALELADPAPGEWRLRLESAEEVGYLSIVRLESNLRVWLDGWPRQPLALGEPVTMRVRADRAATVQRATVTASTGLQMPSARAMAWRADTPDRIEIVPAHEGAVGVSVRVEGLTPDGWSFERSFIGSWAVVSGEVRSDPSFWMEWRR